jgi:hypothetical protein
MVKANWNDISGDLGTLAAPVIDLDTRRIFAVSHQYSGGKVSHWLFALNLDDGSLINAGTEIQGSVQGTGDSNQNGKIEYVPFQHIIRPALLLKDDFVIFAAASHGDSRPYHGWIFAYDRHTLQQVAIWTPTPNTSAGGIWQSGAGLVVSDDGSLLVTVGNGFAGADPTKGEMIQSVVKMSLDRNKGFQVLDYGTPARWKEFNDEDYDIDTACTLIPSTESCVVGAKDAHLYVFNLAHMGGVGGGQEIPITETQDTGDPRYKAHVHGTPIAWQTSTGIIVFVGPEMSHIQSRRMLADGSLEPNPIAYTDVVAETNSMPGAMLASSPSHPDQGLLIASMVRPAGGDANHDVVPGVIRLFDAVTLKEVYNTLQNSSDDTQQFAKFVQITVADGMLLVPSFGHTGGTPSGLFHILGMRDRSAGGSDAMDNGSLNVGAAFVRASPFPWLLFFVLLVLIRRWTSR